MARPTRAEIFPSRPEKNSALEARVAELERRLAAFSLLNSRGPRDRRDVELVAVIARTNGSARGTCREILRDARSNPDLAAALEAADLRSPRELGRCLGRMRDLVLDGRRVRARLTRGRLRWWVEVVG